MSVGAEAPAPRAIPQLAFRSAVALAVVVQLAILREISEGHFMLLSMDAAGTDPLWYLHTLSKITLLGSLALVFAAMVERRFKGEAMLAPAQRAPVLALHLLAFVGLVWLILGLPSGRGLDRLNDGVLLRYGLTSLTFLAWQATAVMLVAPRGLLRDVRRTSIGFVLTGMLAAVVLASKNNSVIMLIRSAIEDSTLDLSLAFYRIIGSATPILQTETGGPIVSVGSFAIKISPVCAGYQGMLAASLIMVGLVTLEWPSLRRNRALALTAAVVVGVFVFNALRIAMLLHIGAAYSAEMALDGFHSYFGTVSLFAVVALGMLTLQHSVFRTATIGAAPAPAPALPQDPGARMEQGFLFIAPMAAYLAALMAAGVFLAGFNWLYPLTATIGLAILYYSRAMILSQFTDGIGFSGFAMGIAVFILWVYVVPTDPEGDAEFVESLFSVPTVVVLGWIVMRTIGSSIVVPVVEELAFRAGLPILVRGWLAPFIGRQGAAVIAFVASSMAFGVLHADLLAGTLAGACYGLLTLRTGRVGDAIVAHAVTNFLIALTAVGAGRWSLW